MSEKLVLIDGLSILNRAFFGIPDLTNSEGIHTNAIYGFLNILFKILDEEQPQYLTVAFDVSAPTFRHQMFDAYKGTRKPMADELRQQIPLIKEVLHAMQINTVEKAGYEADDLIGTIARLGSESGLAVSVVSGDRDLLQLATDTVKIRIPKTKKTGTEIEDYYASDVFDTYQVTPTEFIDLKALMGDTSDNIPGVPGIGEKTASAIISTFHSIENAYEHLEEINPKRARENLGTYYEQAQLSKVLATIEVHAEVDYQIESGRINDFYTQEAYILCKRLEFKHLLSRFDAQSKSNEMSKHFELEEDFGKTESFFAELEQLDKVGAELVKDAQGMHGIAISRNAEHAVFIPVRGFVTEQYLAEKLGSLCRQGLQLCTIELKPLVKFLDLQKEDASSLHHFDCAIASYLLNPLRNSFTYEDIAKDTLGQMVPSRLDLTGKQNLDAAMEEHPEEFLQAVCYPAIVAISAEPVLRQQMQEQEMLKLYEEIELPLIYTLADMEDAGIAADKAELAAYGESLTKRIAELETMIYEGAGEEFNINSPKQLGVILFDKLGMPYGKKTKTGYSTAAEVLDRLAPEYPLVSWILEYRQLTKLKSTYADGLANYIGEDGKIHTTFHQTIAATGRLSSTDPNLQNIPIRMELGRQIRKVFKPAAGCLFVDADYSQIELRVLAAMSGDERLIQAYQEANDIHRITASQVFHVPFEEVTDLQRRNAKAVNFGIVYGISSFGLSQDLSISRKEAEEYIGRYFETYPKIKEFLDRLVTDAKEKGYSSTMYGRRRPVPELSSSNFMQRSFGERVAMNAPIQGTAADIIKIAMIKVHDRLRMEGLRSRLILQVHDELLIEAREEELSAVQSLLAEEMEHAADLSVRLEVDMHTAANWYDAK